MTTTGTQVHAEPVDLASMPTDHLIELYELLRDASQRTDRPGPLADAYAAAEDQLAARVDAGDPIAGDWSDQDNRAHGFAID